MTFVKASIRDLWLLYRESRRLPQSRDSNPILTRAKLARNTHGGEATRPELAIVSIRQVGPGEASVQMLRSMFVAMLVFLACTTAISQEAGKGHYLFVWAGAADGTGNDFMVVIDADPASKTYGRLLTTVATDQPTKQVHHTEYTMPGSGMLFANDHAAGRTFIWDLREPLHPRVAASFTDMDGFMHPHSYVRLPNGHVLSSFQHMNVHGGHEGSVAGGDTPTVGGLVEIDDAGKVVRSASAADPAFPEALLTPYSLVALPEIDRVVSTNSSMHLESILHGATYQVWRLSDLKLLKTEYVDAAPNHYSHVGPQEPRLGPDGAVYIQSPELRPAAYYAHQHCRAQSSPGAHIPGRMVWRAHDCGALFYSGQPGDARLDRAGYFQRGEAGRSFAPEIG